MTKTEAMRQLKAFGTAQNRKVYARHGVGEKMFGVSYADLGKLKRKVRQDHQLALQLWGTGNHDARVFATMIADPDEVDNALLEAWVKDLDNYVVSDAFAGMASRTKYARKNLEKWSNAKAEWVGRTGWLLLAHLARTDQEFTDAYLENYLAIIREGIHNRKNRVRDAMNSALIAIAMRNDKLQKKALAAAKVIGKVEVDHGETGCKTPDAVTYIAKTVRWKKSKSKMTR